MTRPNNATLKKLRLMMLKEYHADGMTQLVISKDGGNTECWEFAGLVYEVVKELEWCRKRQTVIRRKLDSASVGRLKRADCLKMLRSMIK